MTLEEVLNIQALLESDAGKNILAGTFNLSESAYRASLSRIYH